ncbi:hypothetical protein N431DRAFT_558445 [Stipitochalara longipes BDJ]|nr:hypothetical protein N431DRAFT_558445 [Stipitochalara longipes BDJ]
MIQLPSRSSLATCVLLSLLTATQCSYTPDTSQSGLNTTCWQLATQDNVTQTAYPVDGFVVYYVPWSWFLDTPSCLGNGPSGVTADFVLVLTAFALLAVIFSTIIPRRWRLDIPQRFWTVGRSRSRNISKLFLSIPAICVVATVDMIGWITCIMTFAGPMAFSGIQEMLLDFRVISFLERNPKASARETLEAIVALLCGNYDQEPDDPTPRIHSSLIPSQLTEALLESAKSRLVTIMNSQMSFGTTSGIPAVFSLGGFWYNASQTTPLGAVSYGIFLMVLVIVTIISGTLLAGNSPHPNTMMWQQQGTFQDAVRIGGWSWAAITVAAWLLVATPCVLSLSFDYLVPWPWFGSLSLVYATYLVKQTWLILVALIVACLDVPLCTIWRPLELLPKATSRPMLSRSLMITFTGLTGAATFVAALCTIFGSVSPIGWIWGGLDLDCACVCLGETGFGAYGYRIHRNYNAELCRLYREIDS